MARCDKCKGEVSPEQDYRTLRGGASQDTMVYLAEESRHILPVVDKDGQQLCPGSPTMMRILFGEISADEEGTRAAFRAQYLIMLQREFV